MPTSSASAPLLLAGDIGFAAGGRLPYVGAAALAILVLGLVLARRRRGALVASASFLLRALAVGVAVFVALEPVTRREIREPGSVLMAIDSSRSVLPGARAAALDAARDAARGAGLRFVAAGFGAAPRLLPDDPDAARRELPAAGDPASDPLPALAMLLLRAEAAEPAARLLLATDGALPWPPSDLPAVPGLAPAVVATPAAADAAFRVVSLATTVPPVVEEPVQLVVAAEAGRDVDGTLVVLADGREVRRIPAKFAAGANTLALTLPPAPAGLHQAAVRAEIADDEPADNAAVCTFAVSAPPHAAVVSGAARPLVADALKAQGIDVRTLDAAGFLADPGLVAGAGVVVLDRVPAESLSAPAVLAVLRRGVEAGAGLVYLPREDKGEMFDAQRKPFLAMLPLAGREPPPEPPPPEPPPEAPEGGGLKPPDPEARKTEKRLAPTLGLLLLIDASSSMKGETLLVAKAAAVAAAEVLHPEDRICVVPFNREARVALELTPAGDMALIRDRIARIHAQGGTHFGRALEEAREVFAAETLGIRHVILLSDGESELAPLESLVKDMVAKGITVSTVGCGMSFNEQVLSDIAAWGRGKFHPAYNLQEVPQVFTIEAERVIRASGARRRADAAAERKPTPPEPAPKETAEPPPPPPAAPDRPEDPAKPPPAVALRSALPAPYVRGVTPTETPGLVDFHRATARPGAWIALQTEGGDPFLAHGFTGFGRVAALTAPLEGRWAAHLVAWDDYQTLLAQLVRFLHPEERRSRWSVEAWSRGRTVRVRVLDRTARNADLSAVRLQVTDEAGAPVAAAIEGPVEEGFTVRVGPGSPAAGLRLLVTAPAEEDGKVEEALAFAAIDPIPEVFHRGQDLAGLESWARALGGAVHPSVPFPLDVPARVRSVSEPFGADLWPWLLVLLVLDLLLKRFLPGHLLIRCQAPN